MVRRWKIIVEYDGRPFVGWQRQENGLSVQECLETAVHRFTGESPTVHAAGRTDSGVHARAMAASFDLAKPVTAATVMNALNFHLKPHPVAVLAAEPMADDFHARFSCTGRSYLYRIVNRRAPLTLEAGLAWQVGTPLDAAAMHDAAQVLVGRHDFSSFRAGQCQAKSPLKTLDLLAVERVGDEVRVLARARSFLHHQVRNMVGSLKLVGEGRWTGAHLRRALEARSRAAAGPTAPPDGLYFTGAFYDGVGGSGADDDAEGDRVHDIADEQLEQDQSGRTRR